MSKDYIRILDRDNPRINPKDPYSREHRVIMEKVLERSLSKDEMVHHINEDKKDNRIENLQVMTRAEHARHHHKGKHRRDCSKCICLKCNAKNTAISFDKRSQCLHPCWHKIKGQDIENNKDQKWVCQRCYYRLDR